MPGKRCELLHQAQQIEYESGGYIIWGFRNQVDAQREDRRLRTREDRNAAGQLRVREGLLRSRGGDWQAGGCLARSVAPQAG